MRTLAAVLVSLLAAPGASLMAREQSPPPSVVPFGRGYYLGELMKQANIEFDTTLNPGVSFREGIQTGGVVTIGSFNGRLGNQIHSLGCALVFAKHVGAGTLRILPRAKFGYPDRDPIFDLTPEYYDIGALTNHKADLLENCEELAAAGVTQATKWWYTHCRAVPVSTFRETLRWFLIPRMKSTLASCVDAPATEVEQNTLVVHYRTDRDEDCKFADKVLADGNHERMLIVSHADPRANSEINPCVNATRSIKHSVQMGTLLEDACTMLRARYFLLSFSTLPESLAFLSDRLAVFYHRGDYTPFIHGGKDVSFCTDEEGFLWPGTKLVEYEPTSDDARRKPVNGSVCA